MENSLSKFQIPKRKNLIALIGSALSVFILGPATAVEEVASYVRLGGGAGILHRTTLEGTFHIVLYVSDTQWSCTMGGLQL